MFIQKLNNKFIILSFLFCFLTTGLYSQKTNIFSTNYQEKNEAKPNTFLSLEAFKSYFFKNEPFEKKKFSITDVKNVDINQDGNQDWLVFSSDKRRIHLDLLIAGEVDSFSKSVVKYHHVSAPPGDSFEYNTNKNEIKIGEKTYPDYSLRGSDLLLWYDFYQVKNNRLEKINRKYLTFYRKMRGKYKSRIAVLRAEYVKNKKKLAKNPDIVLDLSNNLKIDHIKRYQLFIRRILDIYAGKG